MLERLAMPWHEPFPETSPGAGMGVLAGMRRDREGGEGWREPRAKRSTREADFTVPRLPFRCAVCSVTLHTRRDFTEHMQTRKHLDVRPYMCSKCEFASANPRNLRDHERRVHEHAIIFHCSACQKTYTSTQSLKDHFTSAHTDDEVCKCPRCGKSFRLFKSRDKHLRLTCPGTG